MKNAQDVLVKVLVVVIAASVVAMAGLPSRVTVLESKFDGIDKKLDQIMAVVSHNNRR